MGGDMFKKNDVVKLKTIVPQGPVIKLRMEEDGTIWYLMEWTAEDSQKHSRWFTEAELELVE